MSTSIIRGKHVVCGVADDANAVVVDDGAVFQRDGLIVDIGLYEEVAAKYPGHTEVGSGQDVVLPGFVNSHHHLGVTPFQHGIPDLPLELWLAARIGMREVDPYLDTLYSAFEMIASGVTTVQHLHGRGSPPLDRMYASAREVLRAYETIGMRVSYSYGIRDQNRLVYGNDAAFAASLPEAKRESFGHWLRSQEIPTSDFVALFETLRSEFADSELVGIQLAPVNLQWCSDATLELVRDLAERHDVPIHMHLLETTYQREYAHKRTKGLGAIQYLERLGLLGPRLTLGHAVWITPEDIAALAGSETCVCHNLSSNIRLQTGKSPVDALLKAGVPVAIGIDEAGINDDRDMLQELRLVMSAHRTHGHQHTGPDAATALKMATEYGARTTPFGSNIGVLKPGKAADLIIISLSAITSPYLDDRVLLVDAILQRAKAGAVTTVIIAGDVVYSDGTFTRIDRNAVMEELAASLRRPLTDAERRGRQTSVDLMPHVRAFYDDHGSNHDQRAASERTCRVD